MIIATTAGRFEKFSERFGEPPKAENDVRAGAGTKHVQVEGGKATSAHGAAVAMTLGPKGRLALTRAGTAVTDPVADEQTALTGTNSPPVSAQDYQNAGDDPATDDTTAVGYYQNAAGIAANAALNAATLAPNDVEAQTLMQASKAAASEALKVTVDFPVGTRQAAEGFSATAIQSAQATLDRVRQVVSPSPSPAPNPSPSPSPSPNPSPAPPSPSTGINWTPILVTGIVATAVAVAGYFAWRHLKEGGSIGPFRLHTRANPVSAPALSAGRRAAGDPRSAHIQSLIFPRGKFTAASARSWARSHDFRSQKIDESGSSFRIRQRAPESFKKGTFRTISLGGSGVKAVVARRKA